jgi:hypothetical protein
MAAQYSRLHRLALVCNNIDCECCGYGRLQPNSDLHPEVRPWMSMVKFEGVCSFEQFSAASALMI